MTNQTGFTDNFVNDEVAAAQRTLQLPEGTAAVSDDEMIEAVADATGVSVKTLRLSNHYIRARAKKDDLDTKAKKNQKDLDELQDKLIDALTDDDKESVRFGNYLLSIRKQLWASLDAVHKDAAISALKKSEAKDLVKETVNTQSLSAWARELPKDPETFAVIFPDNEIIDPATGEAMIDPDTGQALVNTFLVGDAPKGDEEDKRTCVIKTYDKTAIAMTVKK